MFRWFDAAGFFVVILKTKDSIYCTDRYAVFNLALPSDVHCGKASAHKIVWATVEFSYGIITNSGETPVLRAAYAHNILPGCEALPNGTAEQLGFESPLDTHTQYISAPLGINADLSRMEDQMRITSETYRLILLVCVFAILVILCTFTIIKKHRSNRRNKSNNAINNETAVISHCRFS